MLAFYDALSDLLMNRCCTLTGRFLRLAVYVSLAVGPYSWVTDIRVTYNHNPSFISFLFERRQRTEIVRELISQGVFVGSPRKKQ